MTGSELLGSLLTMTMWLIAGLTGVHAGDTVTKVTLVMTDTQGNVLMTKDTHGHILARYTYQPYGTQQSGPTNHGPGYTGHVNDPATGLVYMQQRYYDPAIGRFISPDPVVPASGNVFNFGRYTYANNNPLRYTDPDGRQSVGEMIDSAAQGCGAVSCAGYAVLHAAWSMTGAESLSQVADKGWSNVSTGDKVGAVTAVAAVVPVGRVVGKLAEGAEAAKKLLTTEQAANLSRFVKKLPRAAENVSVRDLPNGGKAFQGEVPGRVPGSKAIYEKQVDASGKTVQYTKTTYDPANKIVHVKDKITGDEFR
jgi:RHS repeat-associated protein